METLIIEVRRSPLMKKKKVKFNLLKNEFIYERIGPNLRDLIEKKEGPTVLKEFKKYRLKKNI